MREKTQKQFKRHIDFILQKLDLGREFETGVPLPCFIINHHCQITWGNDLFLEQFSLESHELGKEYLDWKFISKYLLLGDEDPIEKTIMEKVPGVYQVKIKFDDMMTKSYEMHVSPMCTESGEKILILFYPLAFIEESIHSQIQLISKPLEHIIPKIDLMNLQNEEVQSEVNFWIEEIKKSGQDKIYNDLLKLRDRIIEQFNYSADQVSKLSQELQDSKQSLGLIKEESTHFIEEFKNTKSISEHWSEIIDDNQNQIKDFKLVEKKIIKEIRHLNLGIETLKRQIQEIKNKIADAQQYLQQLDQFRKNPDDLKLLESLVMKIQFTLNIYPTEMMDLSLREDSMPSLHQILEKIETNKEKSLVELEKLVEIQSSLFLHAKAINQFNKSKPINQELLS